MLTEERTKADASLLARDTQFTGVLAGQQSQLEQTLAAERAAAQAGLQQQSQQFNTLLTQQSSQYEQTLAQQREQAAANAQLAEEAKNRANQKKPITEAFIAKNERQGLTGQSGTMLTGTGGITSASLPLGKNTLLGS